jgi:hypothetical protein
VKWRGGERERGRQLRFNGVLGSDYLAGRWGAGAKWVGGGEDMEEQFWFPHPLKISVAR